MKQTIAVLGVLAILASGAHAVFVEVDEVEPNDSFLFPQRLPEYQFQGLHILGSLQAGDVDFYAFDLNVHIGTLYVEFLDLSGSLGANDGVVDFLDGAGNVLDTGQGPLMPSILLKAFTAPGQFVVAISGGTDTTFDGLHNENFEYSLLIAALPSPGGALPLALCALGSGRRRR